MKIIFLSFPLCMRVIKEGLALGRAGHSIHFMQHAGVYKNFLNTVDSLSFYNSDQMLMQQLQCDCHKDIDLIHVHNEPSAIGWMAKEARPDVPVVFDAHDLDCMRFPGTTNPDEEKVFNVCDGFIFPSKAYYNGVDVGDKPKEVVYCYGVTQGHEIHQMPRVNGIVYEGTILGPKDEDINKDARDFTPLAAKLDGFGIPFFVYSAQPAATDPEQEYKRYGTIWMQQQPEYINLIDNLSRYDWGFAGAAIADSPSINACMPNKLFDYLSAGIPVMVHGASEIAEFVREHGVGVVLDSLDDIPKVYNRHEKYRKRVLEVRDKFVMFNQVAKIENFYQRVIDRFNTAKPKAA